MVFTDDIKNLVYVYEDTIVRVLRMSVVYANFSPVEVATGGQAARA